MFPEVNIEFIFVLAIDSTLNYQIVNCVSLILVQRKVEAVCWEVSHVLARYNTNQLIIFHHHQNVSNMNTEVRSHVRLILLAIFPQTASFIATLFATCALIWLATLQE